MDRHIMNDNDFPIGLAKPALRALTNAGLTCLEQVSKMSEAELKQLHGIGPNAVKQLRYALELKGLSFANKE